VEATVFLDVTLYISATLSVSRGGVINVWQIGKDLKWKWRGLIEVLYRRLPGGAEENREQYQDWNWSHVLG
jgi:hypothetical protein